MKKRNLYILIFLTLLLVFVPTVSAGEFKLVINPPTEPIYPEEMVEISGIHQLIPGNSLLEKILPDLWMSQYTSIEIVEKPEWLSVTFPDSNPFTPPDGVEYWLTGYVSIKENAPMNTTGTVKLSITTGKFMRTITFLPDRFPYTNEFKMDQQFEVRTGMWEDNTTEQNNTDDSEPEYKPDITNKQEESNICFILFIIIIILTIIVTILWTIKRE